MGKISTSFTLTDIARHSGVSASTVSRVLNNHPGISSDTRRNIFDALRKFGYQPQEFTPAPKRDARMRIDVIICPLPEQKNPMGMDYYVTLFDGIRSGVDPEEVNLKLNIFSDASPENWALAHAGSAGVLLAGVPPQPLLECIQAAKLPFVILSNNPPDELVDLVTTDKFSECLRICDKLVALGVRRLGLLMPAIDTIYCEGFGCGMKRHGFALRESDIQIVPDTTLSNYIEPLYRVLGSGDLPDALVFPCAAPADICEEMLKIKGLRVPEDIRLIAFADHEASPRNYPLIRTDSAEMGRIAAEWLLRKIHDPNRPPCRIVVPMIFPSFINTTHSPTKRSQNHVQPKP